jgi:hypothetical protein
MPTLSASDYTNYLKLKTAAQTGIRPGIQTRDNVTLQQSVLNANIFTSQASLITNPTISKLVGNARVSPIQPSYPNNPNALSTLSIGTGTGVDSSKFQRPGGLPIGFKSSQSTYTRLPQNAGWAAGGNHA